MEHKRVAIYIRVSTLDQATNGYSLKAQADILSAWCRERGCSYQIYEDAGISGKDLAHRPAVTQMLNDIAADRYDIVLVWALSRLTRSVADLYNVYTDLQRHKCELVSYTEPFDTSQPIGRAMMGICGVFAQMEREITAERVRAALTERAAQGKRTCSDVLGYDLAGTDSLRINPDEAERVRYIYDKYIEHRSLSAVAELCKLKGYRGKRGRIFKAWHIKVILTRPIYIGYNSFNGAFYKGTFEPIIERRKWDRVQRLLHNPIKIPPEK